MISETDGRYVDTGMSLAFMGVGLGALGSRA